MKTNPLLALQSLGQHVWLDNLSRELLRSGELQRLIAEDGIDGVTSNPAIFEMSLRKALGEDPAYRQELERLHAAGLGAEACYEALVIPDIQAACDLLMPSYLSSRGEAGYVSLEVSPALAHNMEGTEEAAWRLHCIVARENLLIKVPATPAGVGAFEQLTAAGLRVNVTLIFSLLQYEAVVQAYLHGAWRWIDAGGDPLALRSVASVFLSRVDDLVDPQLEALGSPGARALLGQTGTALAKGCYQRYLEVFHGPAFASLARAGVRPQTPLWASTGSKNPAHRDVLYVEGLIGPETISTQPDATLAAFRDHGRVEASLAEGLDAAQVHLDALEALDIDITEVGEVLQARGVRLFAEAYDKLLAATA